MPASATEAELPGPLQGGHAHGPPVGGILLVDQPAVGVPAGGWWDVLILKLGGENSEVDVPLRERSFSTWSTVQPTGSVRRGAEPETEGRAI
ncbi:MAG TPA: hypothetical protein VNF75_02435 [Candidatus Dormibacteraeota bacterium]|nr:hypothetical protein [Candidatus Dormibacteraeota bacterium]